MVGVLEPKTPRKLLLCFGAWWVIFFLAWVGTPCLKTDPTGQTAALVVVRLGGGGTNTWEPCLGENPEVPEQEPGLVNTHKSCLSSKA